jgi:hypothetical protein
MEEEQRLAEAIRGKGLSMVLDPPETTFNTKFLYASIAKVGRWLRAWRDMRFLLFFLLWLL